MIVKCLVIVFWLLAFVGRGSSPLTAAQSLHVSIWIRLWWTHFVTINVSQRHFSAPQSSIDVSLRTRTAAAASPHLDFCSSLVPKPPAWTLSPPKLHYFDLSRGLAGWKLSSNQNLLATPPKSRHPGIAVRTQRRCRSEGRRCHDNELQFSSRPVVE